MTAALLCSSCSFTISFFLIVFLLRDGCLVGAQVNDAHTTLLPSGQPLRQPAKHQSSSNGFAVELRPVPVLHILQLQVRGVEQNFLAQLHGVHGVVVRRHLVLGCRPPRASTDNVQ